jgi:DNA-binding Lrp family transcriptional regulator
MSMKSSHARLLNLLRSRICLSTASNARLAEHLHCSPRSVSDQLVNLVQAGLIVIQRRPLNAYGSGMDPTWCSIIVTSAADYHRNSLPRDNDTSVCL